jgi:hypothetical protein
MTDLKVVQCAFQEKVFFKQLGHLLWKNSYKNLQVSVKKEDDFFEIHNFVYIIYLHS